MQRNTNRVNCIMFTDLNGVTENAQIYEYEYHTQPTLRV